MGVLWTIIFGNFSGAVPVLSVRQQSDCNKVAVLDCETLVCQWKDYTMVRLPKDSIMVDGNVPVIRSGFMKNESFQLSALNLKVVWTEHLDYGVSIKDKKYFIQVYNSILHINGNEVISDRKLQHSLYRLLLVCDSDEGIYRFLFSVTMMMPGAPSMQWLLSLWLDSISDEVLCYEWYGGQPVVLSSQERCARLFSRIAKARMFPGRGRIF